jgi:ATP-dependent DNA ligase
MKTWPTLYHEGKKGEIRVWILSVNGDTCSTEYGTLNGQMQINKWVCTPKNEGKKNATTSEQQAIIEAEAKYTFQLERKYSTSINTAKQTLFLPMLAHDFAKKKKNLIYPVHVQPKLDGVRALARWEGNTVVLVSRSGKPYNVQRH